MEPRSKSRNRPRRSADPFHYSRPRRRKAAQGIHLDHLASRTCHRLHSCHLLLCNSPEKRLNYVATEQQDRLESSEAGRELWTPRSVWRWPYAYFRVTQRVGKGLIHARRAAAISYMGSTTAGTLSAGMVRCFLAPIPRQYFIGSSPSPMMTNWLMMNPIRTPKALSMKP